jgi:DNA repair exonuclease SbcCD nuclease subunit
MLRPTRWKQVILGDVHDPVQVAKNVRYCGSPMQWHYGDADGKRGFLILDDETMKVEFIENEFSPRFHLLTEVAGEQVRKGDFVRVRTEDADVAREIVKSVQSHYPTRIDVETVEIEGTAPRLAVHAKDQHSEVLRRYIEYQGLGEVPGLVELGVEILEEARHG